jgi:hypothetical protein
MKQMIHESINADFQLRGDAAYFLLLNFDQMVFRPEGPWAPFAAQSLEITLPEHLSESRIKEAYWKIVENLKQEAADSEGYSAHQVMRSIDAIWSELVPYFAWA